MYNTKERKRVYRIISWILTVVMVFTTLNLGGIPASKVFAASDDVTVDFSQQGFSNKEAVSSVTYSGVSVSFGMGTNQYNNAPVYNSDDPSVRCYGGNTITVSSQNNKAFSEINLTCISGDDGNEITASTGSMNGTTWTGSADSVTFTIGDKSGHRRLSKISVTYPIELTEDNTELLVDEFTYNGSEIVPVVQYKESEEADAVTLVEGTDYEVAEGGTDSATNVGIYEFTITGKGDYSGSCEFMWEIIEFPVIVTPNVDQHKTYGEADPTLEYQVAAEEDVAGTPELPAVDFENGMFKKGELIREEGEDAGEYEFDFSDIIKQNTNYDISVFAGTEELPVPVFQILRKQLTDEDILVVAKNSSDKTEENGFEYTYTGKTLEAQFDLYYTDRAVRDDGNKINRKFNFDNPSSSRNDPFKLTNDKDYIFNGTTTAKQPNKTLNVAPYDVSFRGEENYQGTIEDKWSIVAGTFNVRENVYDGVYDGQEHEALEVHPSPSRNYTNEEKTYEYILLTSEEMSAEGFDIDSLLNDPEEAWINYADKATSEVPMIKDVNVDEEGQTIPYIVMYKISMNGYEDYYGAAQPLVSKKDVTLVADDTEPKVYDNDSETDPELTYEDFMNQIIEGETIEGVEISREEGQDAGEYEIFFNLDELNEKYPNYEFDEEVGIFEITKRPADISLGDYEWTYSDKPEEIVPVFEMAGDEGVADGEGILPDDLEDIEYTLKYNGPSEYRSLSDTMDAGEYEITLSRRTSNTNYDLMVKETGTLKINPKNITDKGVKVIFNGSDNSDLFECAYTGSKIEPNIALQHMDGTTNYIKNGKEKASGGPRRPDYRITGVESATDIGYYTFEVEGLNNYTGSAKYDWAILPFSYEVETIYDGDLQAPDYLDDFDPQEYTELFTVEYSTDGEVYATELPKYKDVKRDEKGEIQPYVILYKITYSTEEYGVDEAGNPHVYNGELLFTINPKEVAISPGSSTKKYDGTCDIYFDDLENVETGIEGEAVNLSNIHGLLEDPDSNHALGLNEDVDRNVTVSNTDASAIVIEAANENTKPENYIITIAGVGYATVARRTLERDAFDVVVDDKQYDGKEAATATITCDTGIEGEELSFDTKQSGFFIGENKKADCNVAYDEEGQVTDKEALIIAFAVAGNDKTKAGNYSLPMELPTFEPDDDLIGDAGEADEAEEEEDKALGIFMDTAKILPREVTITPGNGSKIYDGKEVTVDSAKLTFTVEGVDEALAEIDELAAQMLENPDSMFMVAFEDGITVKNAGEYVLYSQIDDGLEDVKNFKFNTMTGAYTITPKAATVKVEDASKKAGEADPTFKYSVTGLVDGDSLKNVKLTRAAGEEAGTYKVSATCDADKNYAITFEDGTLTIENSYKNEWVKGQWYDANGKTDYKPQGSWKQNDKGWWYEDESGWYPVNCWQKIDGVWYHFKFDGYMAASEWIEGYWLDADGGWRYEPKGSWKQDSTGWWYEDTAGWYPQNQWQKIDNVWYYFGADGYLVTNQYVDGYWVNADGAWAE
ncbi:MAG: hypothetical protein K5865_08590 [Eubacterium sp.]|nr:hypothetical protein [Eubacterium sp.]